VTPRSSANPRKKERRFLPTPEGGGIRADILMSEEGDFVGEELTALRLRAESAEAQLAALREAVVEVEKAWYLVNLVNAKDREAADDAFCDRMHELIKLSKGKAALDAAGRDK
jgi:hypothetical protein